MVRFPLRQRSIERFSPARGRDFMVATHVLYPKHCVAIGRAGRVASGTVYRLWSDADEARMVEQTPPEIDQARSSQS